MKLDDKKRGGNIRTGTINDYGTPPKIKQGVKSQKLLRAIVKVRSDKPVK